MNSRHEHHRHTRKGSLAREALTVVFLSAPLLTNVGQEDKQTDTGPYRPSPVAVCLTHKPMLRLQMRHHAPPFIALPPLPRSMKAPTVSLSGLPKVMGGKEPFIIGD